MENIFSDGVITSILERFGPDKRPLLELAFLVLVIAGAVAATLNPIIELGLKLWRFCRWILTSFYGLVRGLFWRERNPPHPAPARQIPEERTIWEDRAPERPIFPDTQGMPIITVANLKGGVGKTTIVANLAIYFRQATGKPILLIDFDYQGSLSQCIRGEAGYTDPDLTADILISPPSLTPDPTLYAREMRRELESIFLYPASYPFATIENNLLADWLNAGTDDLMYRLCGLLKRAEFQDKFGAVLIDCPPRLTASSINALCASTHLLVPTTLDDMSTQAAEYFLSQISRMGQVVFPRLKVIGIVPSIVSGDGLTQLAEQRARDRLARYGSDYWKRDDFVLLDGRVPRRAGISNHAGVGVASLRNREAAQIFKRLGDEVQKRL